jgi:hypothetical protein
MDGDTSCFFYNITQLVELRSQSNYGFGSIYRILCTWYMLFSLGFFSPFSTFIIFFTL